MFDHGDAEYRVFRDGDGCMKVIVITGDAARQAAARYSMAAPDGYVVRIEEAKKKRIQEEKYHAMIGDIAKQCKFMERKWDGEEWKRLLIAAYVVAARENATAEGKPDPFKGKGAVIPSLDGKGFVQLGVPSSGFTIRQAAEFIEYLYAYGEANNVRWSEPGLYQEDAA